MPVRFFAALVFAAAPLFANFAEEGASVVDTYEIRMRLRVPRVYDNWESLGRRRYQSQLVQGEMLMVYGPDGALADVQFTNMVNRTWRLSGGARLTYPRAVLDYSVYPRFNLIGSNRTGIFRTASVCFYLAAEPSYNAGEFDADNALYVMAAGRGGCFGDGRLKAVAGKVAGAMGCGCMSFGHVSPTRRICAWGAGDEVDDVAAVDGTWTMRFRSRELR